MNINNSRVLVLNQDYSAITVCSVQKAFLLVFLKKAELITAAQHAGLRTVSKEYPMPSVVRLINYVSIPYKGVMLTRQNVFKRDGHSCQYCGSEKDLTLDHLIPRSKGGKSSWNNLVTACKRCNARKGDFTPEQAGLQLRIKPFRPSYVMFIRDFSGGVSSDWEPFLSKKELPMVS
jgi:5-methylcytosine-specific restriction endonuclease McrA